MRTETTRARTRRYFSLLFAAIGGGALAGALSHGFFPETTFGGVILWRVTMLLIGVAAAACFILAMDLLVGAARGVIALAALAFVGYAAVILFVNSRFAVALYFYVPASVLLLFAFLRLLPTAPRTGVFGACGMLLTFAAAWVQSAGIALHPRLFDHNATYHLVQAFGLLLVFLAGIKWLRTSAQITATRYNS